MPGLSLLYDSSPDGAAEATTPSATDVMSFSDLASLCNQNNNPPRCATFEDGYWVLSEDFDLFPDDDPEDTWAFFSRSMCDENGDFSTPIVLTLTLDGLFSAAEFSISFDKYGPTWCSEFDVAWYRNNTLLLEQTEHPTGWIHTFNAVVENFNKVVITFRSMSEAYRFLKIQSIAYGSTILLESEDISETDLFLEADLIGNTMPFSTFNFKLRRRENIDLLFQRKQFMKLSHGDELLGDFFISDAKKTKNDYSIQCVDVFGLLDMMGKHMGNIYNGVQAREIIAEILNGAIDFNLSDELDVPLWGYLPIADRRENLRQVVFALGACAFTGGTKSISIRPAENTVSSEVDNDRVYEGGSLVSESPVTEVQLVASDYKRDAEAVTLIDEVVDGEIQIVFAEPMGARTITGGTILHSTANYAAIRGTGGTVTMEGKPYKATQRVYSKLNPMRNANDADNIPAFEEMTLVSTRYAARVLQTCFDYAVRNEKIETKILVNGEKPGDFIRIHTEDGAKTGHILSMDYTISNKLAADIVLLVGEEEAEE